MENTPPQPQKNKKFNPMVLLLTLGTIAILGGIGFILLSKGFNFVMPILSEPGPTSTMIQPVENISENLKQPGILGELKTVEIDASNFKYTPNQIVVNQGDTVQINFTSSQGMHNLVIDDLKLSTRTIQAGESQQVTFVADKKGTFPFYCSVGNHRAMGMEGILVVN